MFEDGGREAGTALRGLRSAAAELAALDPSSVPAGEVGQQVVALREVIDGLEGLWSRLVAVLDGSAAVDGGTASWLRARCRLSAPAARSRVALARRLADHPTVARALSAGDISVEHARLVTTALTELTVAAGPELAAATEAPLVAAARRTDPTRLRREIAHARHALAPEAAAEGDRQAFERRHLDVATTFGGAVVVNGVLDPEGGEALLAALAPLTVPAGPDDPRTPGQRRADGLVELCHRGLDSGSLPTIGGDRPHLTVLVPVAALATPIPPGSASATTPNTPGSASATTRGTAGSASATTAGAVRAATGGDVGAATGGTVGLATGGTVGLATAGAVGAAVLAGPITDGRVEAPAGRWATAAGRVAADRLVAAETTWGAVLGPSAVRRIACDASLTRVLLGPESQPLDVGRRTRTVPAAIRTALTVRDGGCVFPGCDRPPPHTDAHHVVHWADGGPTSLANLVLLCRIHHRTVHEGQWRLARDPAGRWTAHPPDRAAPSFHAPRSTRAG